MPESQTPLVSIITPTFNHEKYIGACIESVILQTYRNWEQIIIDDGSTDRTAEIIRGYSDPRIRYVHQENQGIDALAHTYNCALGVARGALIAVLEGDDFWPPDKLGALVPAFVDVDVVLAYGAVADVSADGTWSGNLSRSVQNRAKLPRNVLFNDPVGSATRCMLRADHVDLVQPSTVVVRRAALDAIGGFQYIPGLIVVDYPTFLTLSLRGKFFYAGKTTGFHRRHRHSVTLHHLEAITRQAFRFATRFMDSLGGELAVTPIERKRIERSWEKSQGLLRFSQGRFLLLKREWRQARVHFMAALKSAEPLVWGPAICGYLASCLHFDLELFIKMAGKAGLSERTPG